MKSELESEFNVNPALIHRRGIYKDTFGASSEYCDYQLRPNMIVAMSVAPESLFSTERALEALKVAKDLLVGPLGIRTLDPADWNYVGDYDSGDSGADPKTAGGFNYHNGPVSQ